MVLKLQKNSSENKASLSGQGHVHKVDPKRMYLNFGYGSYIWPTMSAIH